MKIARCIALVAFTVIGSHSFAQFTAKDFRKLKNLEGNWEAMIDNGFIQEKWTRVNDSTFTGDIFKIVKGVSILDEKAKVSFANGEISYSSTIHYLNKGVPVIFKLVKKDNNKYIFENKDTDFALQITYDVRNSDKMDKTVNRYINGKEQEGPKAYTYQLVRK